MKKFLLVLLLFINLLCIAQIKNNCIKEFFIESPTINLPIYINSLQKLNFKEFNDEVIVCALLDNDKSKLYYSISYYDIDLMKNIEKVRKYYFRVIGYYKEDELYILIYNKGGNDTSQTILCTYKNEKFIDKVIIGFEEGGGDTEMMKYKESVITENLEIKSKYYEWNPEYSSKSLKENPEIPPTIVTISDYKIDTNTGKIILIKQEKKYSKCIPEAFSYPNSNCEIF